MSVTARGLSGHLSVTKKKPVEPKDKTEEEGTVIVADQNNELALWTLNEACVLQQITPTIPDSLYLKINRKNTVCEAC